jgi:hypothetical protein
VADDSVTAGDPAAQTAEQPKTPAENAAHPVGAAINTYVHRIRDIELAGRVYVPAAVEAHAARIKEFIKEIGGSVEKMKSDNAQEVALGIISISGAQRRLERLTFSEPGEVMARSLFLGLFSAFDAFTGQLIDAIFRRRTDLFASIDRTISFKEVLKAVDLLSLRAAVLGDELEAFRRLSYTEQFTDLRRRFDVSLTGFPNWGRFIECSQRRNIITHCDGVVSQQYLDQCKGVGHVDNDLPKLGETIAVSQDYFLDACELMIEVGAKLGHTLWRKVLPGELEDADKALNNLLYDALEAENWPRAKMFGEYACGQRKFSGELMRRHFVINFVQSIKWAGLDTDALKVLDSCDWSASSLEFRLAAAVLRDAYDEAAEVMRQIGKKTAIISATAYHTWPLFRVFRSTPQFEKAYSDVYGYAFIGKVKESAKAAVAQANQIQAQSGGTTEPTPEGATH